ncbi:MAG: efflux transporter outer membrane subunit [Phycisphaerae bacterium]
MKKIARRSTFSLILAGAAALAGCKVGPNYRPPNIHTENGFVELGNTSGTDPATQPSRTTNGNVAVEWWHAFHDKELDHLIDVALQQNLDLQIATARIREARAQRGIAAGDLWPEIDADAGYNHARGSKNVLLPLGGSSGSGGGSSGASGGSGGSGGSKIRPLAARANNASSGAGDQGTSPFSNQMSPFGKGGLPGVSTDLYQVGFDATWELDLFGGQRRNLEAAGADLAASVEARRDVLVTLLAEVARNYVELRGAQQRLGVARENLRAGNEILDLTRSIQKSGLTTDLDVARSAGQVATVAATVPPLEAQVRRSMHALATLLDKNPDALTRELANAQPVPPLPPEVPVGLPSALLERRPDIRRAQRQIAAATARVGVAEADLFPKFGLTGSVGLDATEFTNLFNWGSRYFLLSPTITWPVFDAGRIVSNISLQKSIAAETKLQYRKAVLTALQDVEDALVNYATEQARNKALHDALKQNRDALDIAREQYKQGLNPFLNVLDAERNLFTAQDAVAQSDAQMSINLVAVYKALGGGWQIDRTRPVGTGKSTADARP